ncbi:MAG: hypothetical protein CM1200mP36_07000 [Gammaproteobacteria bacterium]|nr:MAG: hypothetical protein CM1200mP36_07000 [Gammaproteobacteria bacterium]
MPRAILHQKVGAVVRDVGNHSLAEKGEQADRLVPVWASQKRWRACSGLPHGDQRFQVRGA